MKHEITQEQINLIGSYLVEQPYKNVSQLIAIITSLPIIQEPADKKSEPNQAAKTLASV